jgi:hypothetical protein
MDVVVAIFNLVFGNPGNVPSSAAGPRGGGW